MEKLTPVINVKELGLENICRLDGNYKVDLIATRRRRNCRDRISSSAKRTKSDPRIGHGETYTSY